MRLLSAMPSRLRGVVAGVPAMFKECALACNVRHVQLVVPHPRNNAGRIHEIMLNEIRGGRYHTHGCLFFARDV